MQEIEYRAIYREELCPVINISFETKAVGIRCTDNSTIYMDGTQPKASRVVRLDDIELLPYIGIKDIHQKKVFRGDIVKVKQIIYTDCSREEVDETREYIGEVVWHLNGWFIAIKKEKGILYHSLWLWNIEGEEDDTMEILGNRWDNPEMKVVE